MFELEFGVFFLVPFLVFFALQVYAAKKSARKLIRLLPAVFCGAAFLICIGIIIFGFIALKPDPAFENAYFLLIFTMTSLSGLLGCGAGHIAAKVSKTRFAVILPIIAVVFAVVAVVFAEYKSGHFQHNYDLHVTVDEISVSGGDVILSAHSIWNDGSPYTLTVPEKLADRYDLFEGMSLLCDVKDKDGRSVVSKIDKIYKKR